MTEKEPLKSALEELRRIPVEKLLTLHWQTGNPTQRLIVVNNQKTVDTKAIEEEKLPEFLASTIQEHANPSPHAGLEKLKAITIQFPSGAEWGKPVQIWPGAPAFA